MFCSHVSRAIPTNIVSLKTLRAKPTGNTGKFCGADVSLTCIPILLKRSGLHQHKCDHSASAKGLQPPKRITTNRMQAGCRATRQVKPKVSKCLKYGFLDCILIHCCETIIFHTAEPYRNATFSNENICFGNKIRFDGTEFATICPPHDIIITPTQVLDPGRLSCRCTLPGESAHCCVRLCFDIFSTRYIQSLINGILT